MKHLKLGDHWVGDARGAQDYHAAIVSLSARFSPAQPESHGQVERGPELKAQLVLRHQLGDGQHGALVLDEASFAGDSFAQIRLEFDAWAQDRMARIVNVLATEFDLRSQE